MSASTSASSAEQLSVSKRKTEEDVASPVDHRKRRRNRTTQSCLNCHGSKRMCDRKRPACSRCVKLGLSGICVYEVDDVAQREPGKDETSHLKERIAELEGFIREFKRKPHPRWAADLKRRALSSTSSPARSEAGSDDEYMPDEPELKEITSSKSDVSCASAVSPNPASLPLTPPPPRNESVFLTEQDISPSFLYSASSDMPMLTPDTPVERDPMANGPFREGCGTDDLFGFPGAAFPSENDMFERVFSQILHTEECDSMQFSHCECMKKSSAYSVVLTLAPHVRRALDSLTALPEHRSSGLMGSCDYYQKLKNLDSAISAVVESVSSSLTTSPVPSSSPFHSPQPGTDGSSVPIPAPNDSPLARVISARREAAARSFALQTSGPQNLAPVFEPPKQINPTGSLLWGMRQRSQSASMVETSENEQFMSWDPQATPRAVANWPRTISL